MKDQVCIESGAIKFGEEWPGLFLRGDDAFDLANAIGFVLQNTEPNAELALAHKQLKFIRDMILNNVIVGPIRESRNEASRSIAGSIRSNAVLDGTI